MTDRTRLLLLQVALVLGVCYFFFFFGLGAFGLVGADEPRYAQIAREMLARHDWIVPTLNGQPWLEKPVLFYWKAMSSYSLLGVYDWAARVPAAAHATALVLAIFFFMRRFRFASELDAAMIAASSVAMIGLGRAASPDMLVSAPFAMAMLCWWSWRQTGKKLWLALFYALLGVGALAKGPVAPALAVLVVGAYAALRRDTKIFLRTLWAPGFALFFAIALPWYLAVEHRVPEFFRVFFIEHNLERFGTNLYQHAQPFWYYIPVFLLATLPWTVFTVPAIVDTARSLVKKLRAPERLAAGAAQKAAKNEAAKNEAAKNEAAGDEAVDDGLPAFLLIWLLVPIVFFSISRSKLPGYILPAIPAATLLTADYLHRAQAVSRFKLLFHALVCAILLVGALMAPFGMMKQPPPQAMELGMAITGAVIAIMVVLMVRREGGRVLHFVTLVPTILALAFLLRPAAPVLDRVLSARAVQARLVELGVGDVPVAVFHVRRDVAYGLDFYRNQPITYYEPDAPADMPHGKPPQGKHIVIAPTGSYQEVQKQVGERAVASIGDFPVRRLEFFLVSAQK
jgi:4-amino-4-deoxy-L-arabinose transferase-like glycosyltransferase